MGVCNEIVLQCKKCNAIFTLDRPTRIFERKYSCCPNCTKKHYMELNQIEFTKKFNRILGETFELASEYKGCDNPITILHKKCGTKSTHQRAGRILTDYICPCRKCTIARGELAIENFLLANSISYISQKKYDDLIGVNSGNLSYDFFLPDNNLLIEFQGIQHKKVVEYFGGKEQFEIQQEHDRRKREYAKLHNIKLLEIWYWDFNNIENILKRELGIPTSLFS